MAIVGAHALLYSTEPGKLRAVLRDAFGWRDVDAGGLAIFALPPAELENPIEVEGSPRQPGAAGPSRLTFTSTAAGWPSERVKPPSPLSRFTRPLPVLSLRCLS